MKRRNQPWQGPPKLTWAERGEDLVSSDGRFTLARKAVGRGWLLTDTKLARSQWVQTRPAGERWAEQDPHWI